MIERKVRVMDIFEKVGEELTSMAKELLNKSKEFTEVTKLYATIKKEEYKIKEQYKEIGAIYYKLHKQVYEPEFASAMGKIEASNAKIAEAKEELEKRKANGEDTSCNEKEVELLLLQDNQQED